MQDLSDRLERNAGGVLPDFCQTMSSLERILEAYEQAGTILPSQYQCRRLQCSRGNPLMRSMQVPGGARRIRTDDILLAKQALYQLSYGPVPTERLHKPRRAIGAGS